MKLDKERGLVLGVCAGLAKDLGWNPWVVRILFIILAHAVGFGILLYLLFYIGMNGK